MRSWCPWCRVGGTTEAAWLCASVRPQRQSCSWRSWSVMIRPCGCRRRPAGIGSWHLEPATKLYLQHLLELRFAIMVFKTLWTILRVYQIVYSGATCWSDPMAYKCKVKRMQSGVQSAPAGQFCIPRVICQAMLPDNPAAGMQSDELHTRCHGRALRFPTSAIRLWVHALHCHTDLQLCLQSSHKNAQLFPVIVGIR